MGEKREVKETGPAPNEEGNAKALEEGDRSELLHGEDFQPKQEDEEVGCREEGNREGEHYVASFVGPDASTLQGG